MAKISIFLARRIGADDEITITPIINEFKILYLDGVAKTTHFVYASESEVIAYVNDLFDLLANDVLDPFKSIQFTFPCFPSVMYKVPEFSNDANRIAIRDRLISTLRNWPESVRSLGILNPSPLFPTQEAPISPLLNAINPNIINMDNYVFPIGIDRTETRADSDVIQYPDLDFII